MQRRMGRVLFSLAIGLVACSFLLAVAGEETDSTAVKQTLLDWHEWIGLSALIVLVAFFAVHCFALGRPGRPMPRWLPKFRATVEALLYVLLALQPISGWLLASHEGKLATFFGLALPPLVDPSTLLANIGYVYHGAGGALIFLVAILSLRLNLTAWIRSLLPASRRSPAMPRQTRRPKHHSAR